jgi:hypothetical protein
MSRVIINIKSNLGQMESRLKDFMPGGAGYDSVMREIATSMLAEMRVRIHTDGIASDGQPIGTYSPGYMEVRTGVFKTNSRFSKGKNKGSIKPTGVFTKGKNKGEPRPSYNRTSDPKVVISLTRQMENDFTVFATDMGYGLGYNNPDNFLKAGYVEATYKKKIFDLTENEKAQVQTIAHNAIDKLFGDYAIS